MLSPPLWENVRLFAFNQSKNLELSDLQRNDYWRTWFILNFAYQTGLRLQEIVNAKIGDLKVVSTFEGDQWWLDVIGKGNKYREVPISPDLLEAINQHLRNRNLGRIGYVLEDTPLIGKLRGSGRTPLSSSGLYQKLKKFFEEVARHVERTDPLSAEKLKRASTHWLRHTHGSHAVAKGVPLEIVRDNLGHSNISTTSIYLHTDRDDRYKAMLSMGGALATKSDSSP
jgi:integrase